VSRDIFIRHGLVGCDFPRPPPPVRDNANLIASIRRRAEKTRNPQLLDEDRLAAYFDSVIPRDICSADALRKWLRRATPAEIESFRLKESEWMPKEDGPSAAFPDTISIGRAKMRLTYRHSLDDDEDGITCTVRKSDAAALREWRADWLVPGALPEKLAWMISCLPSAQRRILSPIEDTVSRLLTYLRPGEEPLTAAICRAVRDEWGIRIAPDAWDKIRMPVHFLVRFRVRDDATGRIIAAGRDLEEVLDRCGLAKAAPSIANLSTKSEKHIRWDFGDLREVIEAGHAGWTIRQYPALKDEGDGVSIGLYTDPAKAGAVHAGGLARLFVLALGKEAKSLVRFRQLPLQAMLYLRNSGYADSAIADDFLLAIASEAFVRDQPDIRSASAFNERLKACYPRLAEAQAELSRIFFDAVTAAAERIRVAESDERLSPETAAAVKNQLAWLVFPGFLRNVPLSRLRHYRRYLEGIRIRLERARLSPSTDAEREAQVAPYWNRYRDAVTSQKPFQYNATALAEYRWMVEEFRVSVFAQELRTPTPISAKRLDAKWTEVLR
ncbi:MAG: DUF3418 domain-containing protein, partial [Kiritimatiellae bacterium]|nr:DUF3418 domain-containing protein [Kiritimatiellia bacterium]